LVATDQGGLSTTSGTVEIQVVNNKEYSNWTPTGFNALALDTKTEIFDNQFWFTRNRNTVAEQRSLNSQNFISQDWLGSGGITTKEPLGYKQTSAGLFQIGFRTDNRLYTRLYNQETKSWGNWTEGGGITIQTTAKLNSAGMLIALGTDSQVYSKPVNSGSWQRLTSRPATNPTINISGNNLLLTNQRNNRIENQIWNYNSSWSLVSQDLTGGGITVSGIPLGFGDDGNFWQLARGTDNIFYQRFWNGTSWDSWKLGGGITLSGEVIQLKYQNKWWQMARGSDNQIWLRYRLL